MHEEGTSKKVIRNTLFNYLAIICITLIRFIAMPILIHGLGQDRYGIYATLMSVVGYVGLLDLGIGGRGAGRRVWRRGLGAGAW